LLGHHFRTQLKAAAVDYERLNGGREGGEGLMNLDRAGERGDVRDDGVSQAFQQLSKIREGALRNRKLIARLYLGVAGR